MPGRQTARQADGLHRTAGAGPGLHPQHAVPAGHAAVKDPGAAADDHLGLPGDDDDSDDDDDETICDDNDDNISVSPSR